MPYITPDYYNNEFMGAPAASEQELAALILRACDLVDVITQYKIACVGFSAMPVFTQNQIKRAAAYQTEYLIQNGGLDTANSGAGVITGSVSIGKFSVAQGDSTASKERMVSPMCLSSLEPTGLLYRGVRAW